MYIIPLDISACQWLAHLRKQLKAGITDFSTQPQGLTPRAAVSLFMRRPENLTEEQRTALVQMRQAHQEIERVMEVVDHFLTMLHTLQGEQLEDWMEAAQQSNIREMQNFVEKLRKDQQAVQAGFDSDLEQWCCRGARQSAQMPHADDVRARQIRFAASAGPLSGTLSSVTHFGSVFSRKVRVSLISRAIIVRAFRGKCDQVHSIH